MDSGEEIPLKLPDSKPYPFEAVSLTSGQESYASNYDIEKRLLCDNRPSSQIHLRPTTLRRNNSNSHSKSFPTGLDINAMSVISLYDSDYTKEMISDDDISRSADSCPSLYHIDENGLLSSSDKTENSTQNHENLKPAEIQQPPKTQFQSSRNSSLFFNDGIRTIDYVLTWSPDENPEQEEHRREKRMVFEENLMNEGLQLELKCVENNLNFVKIHAPMEVLRRYAEILKFRMPMKEIPGFEGVRNRTTSIYAKVKGVGAKIRNKILVDETHFPQRSHRFTAVYSRDKEYLFDLKQSNFFTTAVKSRIVQFILDRKRFSIGTSDGYAFGIARLISEESYMAAYPLHDGEVNIKGSMRNLLCEEWAAVSKWYRYQPLDYIREYFGVKIGLYFAWLGFYTYMLMLASIVGVGCFLYSWLTMNSNKPSQDICSGKLNIKMCPLCDYWCDYWDLEETCMHVRITYLFDNPTTVFFAIFMSFWATLFLELWKRYSAEITHRWDLTGFDVHEEHPRPQYLARLAHVKKVRIDYVTNTQEPQPPFWRMKLPATVFSFSIVILLIALAVAAILGVVLYRMSMLAALSVHEDTVTTSGAILFTTATAASINLCLIFVFNWMYTWLAEYLTEFELLRTQTEFDDSLTLKIYLLQFVNYYASIFYIAFFKGKFIGYPGQYMKFFNFRQEECGLGGCLMELCIQLAIIMVGKQAFNTMLEMLLPKFFKWLNKIKVWKKNKSRSIKKDGQRWLRDLKLVEWGPRCLFSEYLEMVLQYGFVTIFVAAFPLAPFFALLNNILEMRLDAKKLLTFYRRPVTQRVRNIGVWYRILDSIGKLSVITNGFIIAFTSEFIPRLVYRIQISPDGSLTGYLNHSLSYFNTSDLQKGSQPHLSKYNIDICRYPDYREPPWSNNRYEKTSMYWNILAARLAFVVIFENIVALVMILVRWCIPDMSPELRDQIRREAYITNEIIIKQEAIRAKTLDTADAASEKITKLLDEELSGSQLDLVMHDTDSPIAPGHCKPGQYKNINEAFLDAETGGQVNKNQDV